MSEIERALKRLSKAIDVLKDNLNKDFSSNALHDSSGGKQRVSSFQQSEIAELNTIKNQISNAIFLIEQMLYDNKDTVRQNSEDLDKNWAVVAEAIQTILRREGYANPYETLKGLTRTNTKIDAKSIADFIDGLKVSQTIKAELKSISPSNYTGV